jgi:hypothetical protein
MAFRSEITRRVPVTLVNTKTLEEFEMPFTPTELTENIVVQYARQDILGMSHQNMQYSGTSNYKLQKLAFFFRGNTQEEVHGDFGIKQARLFLMSLCYPPQGQGGIRDSGPPRILFLWPQLVSMTCVITELNFTHKKFNVDGFPTHFVATFDLEEIRDVRLLSGTVRVGGTRRTAAPVIEDAPEGE